MGTVSLLNIAVDRMKKGKASSCLFPNASNLKDLTVERMCELNASEGLEFTYKPSADRLLITK